MKEKNKPILWILGIVLVVLLISQTSFFSNLGLFSTVSQCTIGEQKCCDTPNLYCNDKTGNIQFKCERATTGGVWVNYGPSSSCTSSVQTCIPNQVKCCNQGTKDCTDGTGNYKLVCEGSSIIQWISKGYVANCSSSQQPEFTIPEQTPNQNTPEVEPTPEGTITIPLINVEVTTTQAAIGGVSLLFLIFLFL